MVLGLAASLLLLADGRVVQAQSPTPARVPQNWSLTPPGLVVGDQFRLLFLSSTKTQPDSSIIEAYNAFIQDLAAAGHADIQDFSAGFRAIGCAWVSASDARENTGTTYTETDKGVPIYWLNGNRAADDYEDFYDGSWDEEANDKDETGHDGRDTSQINNRPITGCQHDGRKALDFRSLGSSNTVVGHPNSSNSGAGPLSSNTSYVDHLAHRPMYGLSQVFEVGAATNAMGRPEISGVAQEGEQLRAGIGAIADTDGLPSTTFPAGYSFQWVRVDADGVSNPTDVGRDDVEYALEVADVGKRIKVEVTFTDGGGTEETLPSDAYPSAPQGATVAAPPPREVTVSYQRTGYTVTERRSAPNVFKITLNAVPWREVVVPIGTTDQDGATSDDYTIAPTSVTFSPTDTVKEITFTAARDAVADDGESVKLTFGDLPTGVSAGAIAETIVSITDDYGPGVTVYPTDLTIEEGTSDVGYTVVLDTQPTSDVTIEVRRRVGISTLVRTLTFTTGNWNIPQSVKYGVPQDDDTADSHTTLVHSATGGGYTGVNVGDANIYFTDPDVRGEISLGEAQPLQEDAGTVQVEAVAVTVEEGAPTNDYAMTLILFPITAREGRDYEGVDERLDFPKDGFVQFVNDDGETRYRQTVTFELNILNDGIAEDTETFGVALYSLPGRYRGESIGVEHTVVTINDNDPLGVMVDPGTLEIDEGTSDTYDVVLDTQPAGDVTVTIDGITGTDLTLDKTTLTFTALDWDMPQTVTVTAERDDDQADDPPVILTHTLNSLVVDLDDLSAAEVSVTVTDDDTPVEMSMAYSLVGVGPFEEDAGTVRVEVVAVTNEAGVPSIDYSVRVRSQNDTARSPGDYEAVDETLVFPLDDFEEFVDELGDTRYRQSVYFDVVIVDNSYDEDAETFLLQLSEISGYQESVFGVPEIEVTINDNDTAGVSISKASLEIEEGDSDTYEVVLDTRPSRDVTVTIHDPANTEVTAEPASRTFTPNNWNVARTVTVTADHDSDASDEAATEITHTVSSNFAQYDGLDADSVTVTVTDDDPQMEYSLVDAGPFDEDAGTVQVGVVAVTNEDGVPSIDYAVAVQSEDVTATSGGDYEEVDETLVFAVADFAAFTDGAGETRYRQSVYFDVVIVDNSYDEDAETFLLKLMESPGYEGSVFGVPQTEVTITDNDEPGVSISKASLDIEEGDSDTYDVELDTEPAGDVTVTIGGTAGTDLSLDQDTLTFTDQDWDQPQRVTVTAGEDGDAVDEPEVTLTHTVSSPDDGDYANLNAPGVTVTVTDDDPAVEVSFEQSTYTVAEGSGVTVKVKLDAEPERTVDITLILTNQGGAGSDDYSLSATTLTFGPTDMEKTFTFTAADDADDDDGESVKLSFGSVLPDGVSQGTPNEAVVSITDNDDPAVEVSFEQSSYTVAEGSGVTVKMKLNAEPERTVDITLILTNQGGAGSDDYSLPATTLTFGPTETEKTFTFTAADDAEDDDGESVKLSFGSVLPEGVSQGTPKETVVSIIDDDVPSSLTVSFGPAPTPSRRAAQWKLCSPWTTTPNER